MFLNTFHFDKLTWRFKTQKQAKLQWSQQAIVELKSIPQSSINVILDQNSKYIESNNKLDAPIANVEIIYFSLKQLIQNFGANINKNNEHSCPSVAFVELVYYRNAGAIEMEKYGLCGQEGAEIRFLL